MAIFGGYGKLAALKDYYELAPGVSAGDGNFMKKEREAAFGMELYYRQPCVTSDGTIVFGVDGSGDVYKMVEEEPYYQVISNFDTV